MSSTDRTTALYSLLREDARAFANPGGDSLASLNVEVWCGTGPSAPNWDQPYVVMRLFNRLVDGGSHGQRESMSCELQAFGRPRGSKALAVEYVGDILDGWLFQYRNASAGLVFSKSRTRDTLPTFSDPADRDVYQIRLVAALVVWPQYLTQYTTPSP